MATKKKKAGTKTVKRPNIIIFMADTQGISNLSCYGYHRNTSSNYDEFAKEGTLFENHFVTSPWTLPVHASLFTGRYESGHGAGAQHEGLEPGLPSFPQILTKNGYRTVALNENGYAVSDDPWNAGRGFEELIRYHDPKIKIDREYIHDYPQDENDRDSLRMIGVAKKWIEENALGKSKPFFMFLNNTLPHDPYDPPEPFRSRFMVKGVPFHKQRVGRLNQLYSTIGMNRFPFSRWQMLRALQDGCSACLDHRFGLLVNLLKQWDIYDDTLIIVTGDHGDSLGEHTHYAHHSQNGLWDMVVHTPLIVRLPGVFPRGKRCKEIVQITDIFPMILDLLGLKEREARKSIQGQSLSKALKGSVRDFAVMEAQWAIHVLCRAWSIQPSCDPRRYGVSLKAIRTRRHKYIWSAFGDDMLFDVVKDPDERWNIITQEPLRAKRLQQKLEDFLVSIEQRYLPDFIKPKKKRETVDPYAVRRLQAWGLYRPIGVVPAWKGKKKH